MKFKIIYIIILFMLLILTSCNQISNNNELKHNQEGMEHPIAEMEEFIHTTIQAIEESNSTTSTIEYQTYDIEEFYPLHEGAKVSTQNISSEYNWSGYSEEVLLRYNNLVLLKCKFGEIRVYELHDNIIYEVFKIKYTKDNKSNNEEYYHLHHLISINDKESLIDFLTNIDNTSTNKKIIMQYPLSIGEKWDDREIVDFNTDEQLKNIPDYLVSDLSLTNGDTIIIKENEKYYFLKRNEGIVAYYNSDLLYPQSNVSEAQPTPTPTSNNQAKKIEEFYPLYVGAKVSIHNYPEWISYNEEVILRHNDLVLLINPSAIGSYIVVYQLHDEVIYEVFTMSPICYNNDIDKYENILDLIHNNEQELLIEFLSTLEITDKKVIMQYPLTVGENWGNREVVDFNTDSQLKHIPDLIIGNLSLSDEDIIIIKENDSYYFYKKNEGMIVYYNSNLYYPLKDLPELTNADFIVSDNLDEIVLDTPFSDCKTEKTELSNHYVGEKYSDEFSYKYYSHYYGDFTLYTSNVNYNTKNRNSSDYYITEIRIKSPRIKTNRDLSLGDTRGNVMTKYGTDYIKVNNVISYTLDDKKLEFTFNDNDEIEDIRLYIYLPDEQDTVINRPDEYYYSFDDSILYRLGPFREGLARIKFGDKYGYIDIDGNIAIAPQYYNAGNFSNNRAWVKNNEGKYGYIDNNGNMVTKFIYDIVNDFSEDRASVGLLINNKAKFGFIDNEGNYIIEPAYSKVTAYSQGLASVQNNNTCFIVNKDGEFISKHENVSYFSGYIDSVAYMKIMVDDYKTEETLININGDVIINLSNVTNHGISEDLIKTSKNNEVMFINYSGEEIVQSNQELEYENLFSEGMLVISKTMSTSQSTNDKLYGYMNKLGSIIIEPKYLYACDFTEGLAVVKDKNNKFGYIDMQGNYVIPPIYEEASSFSEGLASVMQIIGEERSHMYIDHTGEIIIEFNTDELIN